jgi:hypothetical protein
MARRKAKASGTPTVKGSAASAEQTQNMATCCQLAKTMGASAEQMAGALATMMQESECVNMHGGDRDSAGVFQQRPSQGWGSYSQVTTVSYACQKFLTPYLNYCHQGQDVISASNAVQRSAFPQAPAQWLPESRRDVTIIMGGKGFQEGSTLGLTGSKTRTSPYEFSRGSANQLEDSWTCMGRLAEEVHWERFMRGGVLWFVSDDWLKGQTPRFTFTEGASGVLEITHTEDSRQPAAECTIRALSLRWAVLPGDAVQVTGQGPGDGLWLVYEVRRTVTDAISEITLKRPVPKLAEPANPTSSTSVNIGGTSANRLGASAIGGGAANGPGTAQALYNACAKISDEHWPYVYGGGHGSCGHASTGQEPGVGFDCSSSVCAALGAVNLGYHIGGPVDVSGTMASSYGSPGPGNWMTVWANSGHVWLQLKGIGRAQRFDTVPGGGPQLRYEMTTETTNGFTPRHWPGL